MIEAYAFLAAFTAQILATSILYPTWFVRYVRTRAMALPADRLALVYPGVDVVSAQKRFLTRYRALHTVIAVLGVLLMIWLFRYMQRPEWGRGTVGALVTAYAFAAHVLPLALIVWLGVRFDREYKQSLPQEAKRKASLQRRGLFDFISPYAVGCAVLGYFLFVGFMIYLRQQHPFPGFAGLVNIIGVTFVYALVAVMVYLVLYGRKKSSLQTPEDRQHAMSVTVRGGVYTCIAVVVFVPLNFSLALLDLRRWEPFALSVFFLICALLSSVGVMARPRQAAAT